MKSTATLSRQSDQACAVATSIIATALAKAHARPVVTPFFDQSTCTVSYVVRDPTSTHCAILDSVLAFDQPSGSTDIDSVTPVINHITSENLDVDWLLETHAHADHLSAAPLLQERLGGPMAIGRHILSVQQAFGKIFNEGSDFARDGSQFDHLFEDGESFSIGNMPAVALHVPGHTPACMAYVIGDAIFVGDTLFMPDYGTARCDFPGGDARQLYRSIRRLMSLPESARVFLCHDYKAEGRDYYAWETTIGAQRIENAHVHLGVTEDEFAAMRTSRDASLSMPKLLLPSVQVNMRGGRFPSPENNGLSYLKIPINAFSTQ